MNAAPDTPGPTDAPPALVIDTNWVLDLCVFHDPRAQPLRTALERGAWRWLTCPGMRSEWLRVLDYPAVQHRLAQTADGRAQAQAWFDRHATPVPAAPACGLRCSDPDDQRFIDLAVQHRATLLSKDRAVLALRRRLERLGLRVQAHWP